MNKVLLSQNENYSDQIKLILILKFFSFFSAMEGQFFPVAIKSACNRFVLKISYCY